MKKNMISSKLFNKELIIIIQNHLRMVAKPKRVVEYNNNNNL